MSIEEPEALDFADKEERAGDDDRHAAVRGGQSEADGGAGVGFEEDTAWERRRGGQELLRTSRAFVGDSGQDDRGGDGEKDTGHRAQVLVLHGGEDEDDRASEDLPDMSGEGRDPFDVMGAVEK